MYEFILILPVALLMDTVFGDPETRFHPVRLMGQVMEGGQRALRRIGMNGYAGGFILLVIHLLFFVGGYIALDVFLLQSLPDYATTVLHGFLLYLCIAFRSLFDHSLRVMEALREDELDEARDAVQHIVGRKAESLDAYGVGRATVESMAEGFVDALVSPLFWFLVGLAFGIWTATIPVATMGIAFALGYRVVNTLDAMVGYRSERYRKIGWCSARMDDLLNFLPARMAVPVLFVSTLVSGLDADHGVETWLSDRFNHLSPNAGQTESFVAGALHVRLGGPSVYEQGVVEKPWIGNGTPEVTEVHIKRCIQLMMISGLVAYVCAFVVSTGLHRLYVYQLFGQ